MKSGHIEKSKKKSMARTIFHEVAHITDENCRESVISKERLQNASDVLKIGRFYEWTNTIFEKLAIGGNFYRKNDAMQIALTGYEDLAPLGSMLSCALGIPEIEFAKIKDKGKDYENQLLEKIFPSSNDSKALHGSAVLNNIKNIFNKYNLYAKHSEKRENQNLLNEMYSECLEIMKKRIEIDLQRGNIKDIETYKKYQMFFLKKMNFNFKAASKSNGSRFSSIPVIHDIGYCSDNLPKEDLKHIANEHIKMVDFGFNDEELEKYNKSMIVSNKKTFFESIKVSVRNNLLTSKERNRVVHTHEFNEDTYEKFE